MLLKNALVLIGGNLEKKDLKISDGIIVEINDSIDNVNNIDDSVAEDSFDLSGMIIIPGFVNTHTHIGMSLLRGLAEDLNFDDWLFKNIL
ncbi:MAG: amidohydrolase family protein, partial [Fervidobacterium sp.]